VKYTLDELDEMHTHPEVEFVGEVQAPPIPPALVEPANQEKE